METMRAMEDTHVPAATCMRAAQDLEEQGYAVVEGFASPDQVERLRNRMVQLVSEHEPSTTSVFSTTQQAKLTSDEAFLQSADRISFFYEEKALDASGALRMDKSLAVNKVGHALHDVDPVFRAFSRSEDVSRLCRALGFRRPVPVQSMYICKQPGIGGEVVPHQDSAFLHTEPPSVVGLWIALEDATTTNGCLWAWPRSHRRPLARRFVKRDGKVGYADAPHEEDAGDVQAYVPLEVKRGTAVLLHGQLWHFSHENRSDRSRHAYTMHVVESDGARWSEDNWLQRHSDVPFVPLYTSDGPASHVDCVS